MRDNWVYTISGRKCLPILWDYQINKHQKIRLLQWHLRPYRVGKKEAEEVLLPCIGAYFSRPRKDHLREARPFHSLAILRQIPGRTFKGQGLKEGGTTPSFSQSLGGEGGEAGLSRLTLSPVWKAALDHADPLGVAGGGRSLPTGRVSGSSSSSARCR